jgi:hypothetical protein
MVGNMISLPFEQDKEGKYWGGGGVPPPPFFIGALGIGGAIEEKFEDIKARSSYYCGRGHSFVSYLST